MFLLSPIAINMANQNNRIVRNRRKAEAIKERLMQSCERRKKIKTMVVMARLRARRKNHSGV